jgi:hypothetical protein
MEKLSGKYNLEDMSISAGTKSRGGLRDLEHQAHEHGHDVEVGLKTPSGRSGAMGGLHQEKYIHPNELFLNISRSESQF